MAITAIDPSCPFAVKFVPSRGSTAISTGVPPAPTFFADVEHWRFVHFPFADDDGPVDRHARQDRMHAVDSQLVCPHLVAFPHESACFNGCRFRNANEFQCEHSVHIPASCCYTIKPEPVPVRKSAGSSGLRQHIPHHAMPFMLYYFYAVWIKSCPESLYKYSTLYLRESIKNACRSKRRSCQKYKYTFCMQLIFSAPSRTRYREVLRTPNGRR